MLSHDPHRLCFLTLGTRQTTASPASASLFAVTASASVSLLGDRGSYSAIWFLICRNRFSLRRNNIYNGDATRHTGRRFGEKKKKKIKTIGRPPSGGPFFCVLLLPNWFSSVPLIELLLPLDLVLKLRL